MPTVNTSVFAISDNDRFGVFIICYIVESYCVITGMSLPGIRHTTCIYLL